MKFVFILIFALFCYNLSFGQIVNPADTASEQRYESNLNSVSQKLVSSFSNGMGNDEIAEEYYNLAMELVKQGDYKRAEIYLIKAIETVTNKKQNKRIAIYYRELAKVQEILLKKEQAAKNFSKASEYSDEKTQKQINSNDANRVQKKADPEIEMQYLNQNAFLLSNTNDNKEKAYNYNQMANVNISMNQTDQAFVNYKNALTEVDEQSKEAIEIKSDIANLLAGTNNYTEAINVQKQVVEQSSKISNVQTQVQQMRQLSEIYFANKSTVEGLQVLLDAYNISVEKGNVMEARASLMALVSFYESNKDNQEILELYKDFVANLDTLISKDNSLIDIKLFQITEDKISQLEKEKVLKDELIERKNYYNFMLFASVVLLLIFTLLTVKAWASVKKRNKQIALQSLRREMNPHFIFNSLNSVNQFIANNNELEANKYLTSYSNLMRRIMENSNNDYVSLNVEIDQLNKYLELERLRFSDKFEYSINVDPDLDMDAVKIPNMIIQPNLENAIWHGLRYKDSMGFLSVNISKLGNKTIAIIEDNGIGLEESKKIKTQNQKMHESRGLKNVQERIKLLNEINNSKIKFEISEKTGESKGVIVRIEF